MPSGFSLAFWALVTLAAAASMGCTVERNEGAPQRAANVPAEAVWIGGPDGGAWVELRRDKSAMGLYRAKIQYETGALAYEGPLRRDPPSDQPVDAAMIEGWDGDELLLSGGGSLRVPQ